jgi:hypothetical protein
MPARCAVLHSDDNLQYFRDAGSGPRDRAHDRQYRTRTQIAVQIPSGKIAGETSAWDDEAQACIIQRLSPEVRCLVPAGYQCFSLLPDRATARLYLRPRTATPGLHCTDHQQNPKKRKAHQVSIASAIQGVSGRYVGKLRGCSPRRRTGVWG